MRRRRASETAKQPPSAHLSLAKRGKGDERAGHTRLSPAARQTFPCGGSKGNRAARPAAFSPPPAKPFPAADRRGTGRRAPRRFPRRPPNLSLRRTEGEPGGALRGVFPAARVFFRQTGGNMARPRAFRLLSAKHFPAAGKAFCPEGGHKPPSFSARSGAKGCFRRPGGRGTGSFFRQKGRCNCCFLWITSVIFGITPLNPPAGGPNGGALPPARARERGKLSTVPQFVTTAFHKKISPYPQPISRQ